MDMAIEIETIHHLQESVVDVRASGWCCSGQMFSNQ